MCIQLSNALSALHQTITALPTTATRAWNATLDMFNSLAAGGSDLAGKAAALPDQLAAAADRVTAVAVAPRTGKAQSIENLGKLILIHAKGEPLNQILLHRDLAKFPLSGLLDDWELLEQFAGLYGVRPDDFDVCRHLELMLKTASSQGHDLGFVDELYSLADLSPKVLKQIDSIELTLQAEMTAKSAAETAGRVSYLWQDETIAGGLLQLPAGEQWRVIEAAKIERKIDDAVGLSQIATHLGPERGRMSWEAMVQWKAAISSQPGHPLYHVIQRWAGKDTQLLDALTYRECFGVGELNQVREWLVAPLSTQQRQVAEGIIPRLAADELALLGKYEKNPLIAQNLTAQLGLLTPANQPHEVARAKEFLELLAERPEPSLLRQWAMQAYPQIAEQLEALSDTQLIEFGRVLSSLDSYRLQVGSGHLQLWMIYDLRAIPHGLSSEAAAPFTALLGEMGLEPLTLAEVTRLDFDSRGDSFLSLEVLFSARDLNRFPLSKLANDPELQAVFARLHDLDPVVVKDFLKQYCSFLHEVAMEEGLIPLLPDFIDRSILTPEFRKVMDRAERMAIDEFSQLILWGYDQGEASTSLAQQFTAKELNLVSGAALFSSGIAENRLCLEASAAVSRNALFVSARDIEKRLADLPAYWEPAMLGRLGRMVRSTDGHAGVLKCQIEVWTQGKERLLKTFSATQRARAEALIEALLLI